MRQILFLLLCAVILGCPPKNDTTIAEPTPSGCGKDTDCKGERICIASVCQTPPSKDTGPREGKWLTMADPEPDPKPPSGPGTPGEKVAPASALEDVVLAKMNELRAANKLSPLSASPKLQSAAKKHSEEMAKLGYFSHQSPTPGMKTFMDRVKATGADGFSTGGENIIYREDPAEMASLADALLDQWLKSPPHKANILSKDYFVTGLGFYREGNKVWGTQVFVDRLSGM
jgi:uncharacterized protein YkwD